MAAHPKLGLGRYCDSSPPAVIACGTPSVYGKPVTAKDVLRALVDGADLLGTDPDGDKWLLIRTTPHVFKWLERMDALTEDTETPFEDDEISEDDEPNGDEQESDGDELAPHQIHANTLPPSQHDAHELELATRWIKSRHREPVTP